MTTPTACRSNPLPGPLISPLLIPSLFSLSPFFHSSLYLLSDLSALAKKIKLEAMASYSNSQQHGGLNGENGEHNPGLGG